MVRKHKVAYLVGMVCNSLLSGILDIILYDTAWHPIAEIGGLLVFALLALMWVKADAAERSLETSWGLRAGIVLFAALAVPLYLLKSRGVRGLLAIVGAAGVVGVMCIAYYAGWSVAYAILYRA